MKLQKTLKMVQTALFSGILCVLAPFTVPIPISPVPLSLATFVVYLAAVLLGACRGAVCVLVYLALGLVGLPVFSGFSGGAGVLLGPTGGYLAGYAVCALIAGFLTNGRVPQRLSSRKNGLFLWNVLALALGTFGCYGLGTIWFLIVMDGTYTVLQALLICVVPYLVFDVIKILAAAAVALPVNRILWKTRKD